MVTANQGRLQAATHPVNQQTQQLEADLAAMHPKKRHLKTMLFLGGALLPASLIGCDSTAGTGTGQDEQGLQFLGAQCNTLNAEGCNPRQLPNYNKQTYQPLTNRFIKITKDDVYVDDTEIPTYSSTAQYWESTSSVSNTNSKSFGLDVSASFKGIPFTLSPTYQTLVDDMQVYETVRFYSETYRSLQTFSVSLKNNETWTLQAPFKAALDKLPVWSSSGDSTQQWFKFLKDWGTHYTKTANFGGVMKLTSYLSSDIKDSTVVKKSQWGLGFEASYAKIAGLDFDYSSSFSTTDFQHFQSYNSENTFVSYGGSGTTPKYNDWIQTVKGKPTVIETKLAPLSDFLNATQAESFNAAVDAYYVVCPHTESGICNGYGSCDPTQNKPDCTCDPGSYQNKSDGNCYPNCASNCNGHGDCQLGKCICKQYGYYGYWGTSCSDKCGSHTYSAGGDSVWGAPPDYHTSLDKISAPCFCQYVSSLNSGMNGKCDTKVSEWCSSCSTYNCGGGKVCSASLFGTCDACRIITCQYGQLAECPADVVRVDDPDAVPEPHQILNPCGNNSSETGRMLV